MTQMYECCKTDRAGIRYCAKVLIHQSFLYILQHTCKYSIEGKARVCKNSFEKTARSHSRGLI